MLKRPLSVFLVIILISEMMPLSVLSVRPFRRPWSVIPFNQQALALSSEWEHTPLIFTAHGARVRRNIGKGNRSSIEPPADSLWNKAASLGELARALEQWGQPAQLDGRRLSEYETDAELMVHIRARSIIEEEDDVRTILQAKLRSLQKKSHRQKWKDIPLSRWVMLYDGFFSRDGVDPGNYLLLAGGTGFLPLFEGLQAHHHHRNVPISVLQNAYDDGKSTGVIRKAFGILGPSDISKALTVLIDPSWDQAEAVQALLNYRFPTLGEKPGKEDLIRVHGVLFGALSAFDQDLNPVGNPADINELAQLLHNIADRETRQLMHYLLEVFDENVQHWMMEKEELYNFSDHAIRNLFFYSAYRIFDEDYTLAINFLRNVLHVRPENNIVLNNTEPYVLIGLTQNETLLENEAAIVGGTLNEGIADIVIAPRPLTSEERDHLNSLKRLDQKLKYLHDFHVTNWSDLNATREALTAIKESTAIVFAPTTLYSSLIPTLITQRISTAIRKSRAPKIYVANLLQERGAETVGRAAALIQQQLNRYRSSAEITVLDYVIVNSHGNNTVHAGKESYVPVDRGHPALQQTEVIERDIESGERHGRHEPGLTGALVAQLNVLHQAGFRRIGGHLVFNYGRSQMDKKYREMRELLSEKMQLEHRIHARQNGTAMQGEEPLQQQHNSVISRIERLNESLRKDPVTLRMQAELQSLLRYPLAAYRYRERINILTKALNKRMPIKRPLRVIIMAGGKGTRLQGDTYHGPKALFPFRDIPILIHMLLKAKLDDLHPIVVIPDDQEGEIQTGIETYFPGIVNDIVFVHSSRYRGSGGDILSAREELAKKGPLENQDLLIYWVDAPGLRTRETVRPIHRLYQALGPSLALGTAIELNPYAGILRSLDGEIIDFFHTRLKPEGVSPKVGEHDGSFFVANAGHLFDVLEEMDQTIPAGQEIDLLETFPVFCRHGYQMIARAIGAYREFLGINTLEDAEQLEQIARFPKRRSSDDPKILSLWTPYEISDRRRKNVENIQQDRLSGYLGKQYRALVLDVDDTLTKDRTLSRAVVERLMNCLIQGIPIALITGRSQGSLERLLSPLLERLNEIPEAASRLFIYPNGGAYGYRADQDSAHPFYVRPAMISQDQANEALYWIRHYRILEYGEQYYINPYKGSITLNPGRSADQVAEEITKRFSYSHIPLIARASSSQTGEREGITLSPLGYEKSEVFSDFITRLGLNPEHVATIVDQGQRLGIDKGLFARVGGFSVRNGNPKLESGVLIPLLTRTEQNPHGLRGADGFLWLMDRLQFERVPVVYSGHRILQQAT